jgi:hypothetical protein
MVIPLDAVAVWLGPHEYPDLIVGSFEEAERVIELCHAGQEHPVAAHTGHRHATSHAFRWAPTDLERDLGYPATPMVERLYGHCESMPDEMPEQIPQVWDATTMCACRFVRPLFPITG